MSQNIQKEVLVTKRIKIFRYRFVSILVRSRVPRLADFSPHVQFFKPMHFLEITRVAKILGPVF
jgi:hypothetical protein